MIRCKLALTIISAHSRYCTVFINLPHFCVRWSLTPSLKVSMIHQELFFLVLKNGAVIYPGVVFFLVFDAFFQGCEGVSEWKPCFIRVRRVFMREYRLYVVAQREFLRV